MPARLRPVIAGSAALRALALWPFVWKPSRLSPEDALLLIDGAGAPGVFPTARAIAASSGWERQPVDVPAALINSDHDLIAPLADLRAYPVGVDQALVVKGTGHLPMLEVPEKFVEVFDAALDGPPRRV